MAGQIILSVAYGIDVLPEGDPFVADAENVLRALQLGSTREATIFDTITWCNTSPLPSLIQGTNIINRLSRSAPYAELVSGSGLQTTCTQVAPHRRQCYTIRIRQGEDRTCKYPVRLAAQFVPPAECMAY
jgi:hypothetical protein